MTRFVLLLLLAWPAAAAFADTIKLKSGEVLEGRVVSSDSKTVTFETKFSPTIVDQQTYARADIADLSVESGDEIAYAKISGVKTPDTALTPKACQAVIDNQLAPFLKEFPASPRAADVQRQIKSIQADLAKLKAGEVKVSGIWYDKAAFIVEKYQIQAATVLEGMKQQMEVNNFPAAMNSYDLLLHTYPNSVAYVESVPLVRKALENLQLQLNAALGNLPQTMARRQASIDRTPVEEQAPIRRAIEIENARATATALVAQKNGQRFFAIFPFDEKGIKAMQTAAQQAETQLKLVDLPSLSQGAQLVRRANEELSTHQLAAAETTLAQLRTAWTQYEGLPRMEQQLQADKQANLSSDAKEKPATPSP